MIRDILFKKPHAVLLIMVSSSAWALPVHRTSGGTTTDYATIQAAVTASIDGDEINIDPGTYVEQVTITKAITLNGSGQNQTIIQAPNPVVQTGGNWKTLKNLDVYAVVGVKADSNGLVTIKNLTVNGNDQGWQIDWSPADPSCCDFQGIGTYNTNTLIENVYLTRVRALSQTSYPNYLPSDQPSGYNHNESILAESALGAGEHILTVKNSTLTKFQKTALLAWGPTLTVNIHDNLFQGYGQTLHSSGNGIQISSSDLTSSGGGDRRGTKGQVVNNRILGFGHVIPRPPESGFNSATNIYEGGYNAGAGSYDNNSYLNLGQGGPSGILLYEAGDGFQISGNTITGPGVSQWFNALTFNEGGFNNTGINLTKSPNAVVTRNYISGFDGGVIETEASSGSVLHITLNALVNNPISIWASSGDDDIVLTGTNQTLAYNQTDNGVDTISYLSCGDSFYIVGFATDSVNGMIGTQPIKMYDSGGDLQIIGYKDAHPVVDMSAGLVSLGDGIDVPANTVELSYLLNQTILYVNSYPTSGSGPAPLKIILNGHYPASFFTLNGSYILTQGCLGPAWNNEFLIYRKLSH